MKHEQILFFIDEYTKDIKKFMEYFEKKYNRRDVLRAWHEDAIPCRGNVTEEIAYELHGIGCCAFFPDREVDFDFGPESRIDGLDVWKLIDYIQSRKDLAAKAISHDIEAEFQELINDGIIEKRFPRSKLFFFKNERIID